MIDDSKGQTTPRWGTPNPADPALAATVPGTDIPAVLSGLGPVASAEPVLAEAYRQRGIELLSVAKLLTDACRNADPIRLVMPDGRREDVVEVLTRCLVNRAFCNAYIEALGNEHRTDGIGRTIRSLGRDEIPEAEIAARGFAHLSDDELVDLAASPSAVWAIAKVLTEIPPEGVTPLEAGDWFFAALDKDEAYR